MNPSAKVILLLGHKGDPYAAYINALLAQSPLALWDAGSGVYSDAGTTPAADGALVQQWNDQSGNGYHMSQATSGDRPVFRASVATLNTRPGVEFVSSDYLIRTVTGSILANLNAFTNYVVFRTTSSASGTFYNESDNTFTTRFFVNRINLTFTGAPRCAHSDNATVILDLNPGTALDGNDGAAHLITWRRIASNSWALRLDGVQIATATTATGATTINRIAIGALVRTTLSQFFVGHIATVANYGADNYQDIEPIIAAHYGITLP